MNRRADARQSIFEAAEAIVAEAGAANLTLDKVAERAGLSKGGLLYHFPSKESLLQAMIARLLERADADKVQYRAELGDTLTADLEAHILAGFQVKPEQKQIAAALLAAAAVDPKLLEPVREWYARTFDSIGRTKRLPTRAAAIMMAIDGLWLNELLQTSPLSVEERKGLLQELLNLARSTG